jgi:hypothetical protein
MAVEWEGVAKRAREGETTEARARSVINSIMEHAGQEPVTFYKTGDWFNEWLEDKRLSSEATTFQKYEPMVRRFLEHLGLKVAAHLPSALSATPCTGAGCMSTGPSGVMAA